LTEKAFQKLLLEAVDEALCSLGDSARQSIYYHLESKFELTRDEIPCRLEDFEVGLEKIFGEGTHFLEILIMKQLYEKVGTTAEVMKWDESKEFKFTDYVKAAEQNFLKKNKRN
jgi:hypothetical protein